MRAANQSRVVLVVEDEWLLRDVIAEAFRNEGWRVLEAGTAEGAISLLGQADRIDVVFTDIQLGGYLSGWDVGEAFRAAQPGLPVIYASGNSVDRSRTVRGGQFFDKPYEPAAVVEACNKVV